MEINPDTLHNRVKRRPQRRKPLLNEEQVKETMTGFPKGNGGKTNRREQRGRGEKYGRRRKIPPENKKKEGVKTTASGLQYKVLKEGTGASPRRPTRSSPTTRGRLLDGTEFDSSYKRNEPATFPVNRVITGWTEALQLMKPGSKYQLFIPANLAYGERGVGKDIGPNSALIFEVELLSIKPPEATPTPPPPGGQQAHTPAAAAPPAPKAPVPRRRRPQPRRRKNSGACGRTSDSPSCRPRQAGASPHRSSRL